MSSNDVENILNLLVVKMMSTNTTFHKITRT